MVEQISSWFQFIYTGTWYYIYTHNRMASLSLIFFNSVSFNLDEIFQTLLFVAPLVTLTEEFSNIAPAVTFNWCLFTDSFFGNTDLFLFLLELPKSSTLFHTTITISQPKTMAGLLSDNACKLLAGFLFDNACKRMLLYEENSIKQHADFSSNDFFSRNIMILETVTFCEMSDIWYGFWWFDMARNLAQCSIILWYPDSEHFHAFKKLNTAGEVWHWSEWKSWGPAWWDCCSVSYNSAWKQNLYRFID